MRRIIWFVSMLAVAAFASPAALGAQAFQGTGPQATDFFPLDAALAIFDLEHQGEGAFSVRLLDEQGRVVEELAQATGAFQGSKAVRVEQGGRYLLDVTASGPWSVQRRVASAAAGGAGGDPVVSEAFTEGQVAGGEAAAAVPTNGWILRGMLGGAVAGPIGAAIAVGLAGGSGVDTPALTGTSGGEDYRMGYEDAFAARVREQRKKKAFIGGMVGSGIFIAGLIMIADLAQGGKGGGVTDPPSGGGEFVIVPR